MGPELATKPEDLSFADGIVLVSPAERKSGENGAKNEYHEIKNNENK